MLRRPHRLPDAEYVGQNAVSFTACEDGRRPILATREIFAIVTDCLTEACHRHACTAPIYVLMPDHFHVLLVGQEETSDLRKAIATFKRLSGNAFRKSCDARWQEGSYDTIVRGGRWEAKARYIARNPYRAGLLTADEVWPYTGAIGHNLDEVVLEVFW